MPQFDATTFPTQLFWLALCFTVLCIVMVRTALPRVANVLEARRSHIDHDLQAAEKLKTEAEHTLAAYEKTMAEARAEAQSLLRKAAEEMAAQSSAHQAELAKKLADQTKVAETNIEAAKTRALADIKTVATEAARAATAKLIGVSIDPAEASAAVEKMLGQRK